MSNRIGESPAVQAPVSRAKQVLVCGSRGWTDEPWVYECLSELAQRDEIEVMHGGAVGPDIFAYRACLDLGITARSFLPDYQTYGHTAPHVRNDRMLDRADLVLAFWDGESRGTASVIKKARARRIPVEVVLHTEPAPQATPPSDVANSDAAGGV